MLGWSVGFFLAAIVAAVFGFGGMASTFAGIAQLLFWVFLALLAVSLVFGLFGARRPLIDGAPATHGHGGGGFALLAVAVVVGFAVYAWMDNDMSAERAGRELDQTAAEISAEAGEVVEAAGDRAQNLVDDTADEMRTDAAEGLDEAEQRVENTGN